MKKFIFGDVPAWLAFILAAHRVQPVGTPLKQCPRVRRESPMWDSFENCPE